MSENYFYSSLTGQQIEDTLTGAVRFNAAQALTTSQKQQARDNIGAGADNTGFAILGYYEDVSELPTIPLPQAGDAYGVGTEVPYDIYVWDALSNTWVNNGPINEGEFIDDNDTSTTTTWSSQKINAQLGGKQAAISAAGMLKGTGSAVQAATLGSDYTAVDDTLSSSTTKTYSIDKIKSLEPTGIVHYDQAQTLTDAQKAQARTNIGAGRPWTLLWTNQNPASDFAEQTIPLDLSQYQEVSIVIMTYKGNDPTKSSPDTLFIGTTDTTITHLGINSTGANYAFARNVSVNTNGVTFADAHEKTLSSTGSWATANNRVIPVYIYAR